MATFLPPTRLSVHPTLICLHLLMDAFPQPFPKQVISPAMKSNVKKVLSWANEILIRANFISPLV